MATATADAALASATAAGAASAGGGAPSAPASTGAGGGTGDAGGAVLTDDAILGIEGSGETSTASATATGATQQQTQTITQQTAGTAAPAELAIDQFKPLFQANPQVQSLWDKYSNANGILTQFGTPAEARQAAETVQAIGGVKNLADLAAKASGADQTDAAFFGGSKQERAGLVNEWYDGEGQHDFPVTSRAIAEMTEVALETMFQRDAGSYRRIVGDLTKRALDSIGYGRAVTNAIATVRAAAQSGEFADALKAIDQLEQLTGHYGLVKRGGASQDETPEARQLAADREAFNRERSEFTNSQTMNVVNAADQKAGTALNTEIAKTLDDMKVNDRPVFGEKSARIKALLAEKVRLAVDEALTKNPVFAAQVHSFKSRGVAGREQELIDLTMRFARLALPQAVKDVVTPWTESVVQQSQGAADRARAGASRTEVSGGTAAPGGTKKQPFTSEELKKKGGYTTLSDDDILNS